MLAVAAAGFRPRRALPPTPSGFPRLPNHSMSCLGAFSRSGRDGGYPAIMREPAQHRAGGGVHRPPTLPRVPPSAMHLEGCRWVPNDPHHTSYTPWGSNDHQQACGMPFLRGVGEVPPAVSRPPALPHQTSICSHQPPKSSSDLHEGMYTSMERPGAPNESIGGMQGGGGRRGGRGSGAAQVTPWHRLHRRLTAARRLSAYTHAGLLKAASETGERSRGLPAMLCPMPGPRSSRPITDPTAAPQTSGQGLK